MKAKTLQIALAKIKLHDRHAREFCAVLTPSEFLTLCVAGIQPSCKYDKQRALERKAKGDSEPSWYYFKLGGLKPHGKTVEEILDEFRNKR